jgi:hypothetical protein
MFYIVNMNLLIHRHFLMRGGIEAKVLFLLEAAGLKAVSFEFIS